LLYLCRLIDIAEEGKGVGKTDDFVLFVDKAIPGDVVDVQVYKSKKNFGEGKIMNLKTLRNIVLNHFASTLAPAAAANGST
jgi:tRNA/tmRNA/rRNA uracil-C5-methylase (TrmA/RlmC/RlmD family)